MTRLLGVSDWVWYAAAAMAAACWLVGCTDPARVFLAGQGYTNVRMGDGNPSACPLGLAGREFDATDREGARVHGVLCESMETPPTAVPFVVLGR